MKQQIPNQVWLFPSNPYLLLHSIWNSSFWNKQIHFYNYSRLIPFLFRIIAKDVPNWVRLANNSKLQATNRSKTSKRNIQYQKSEIENLWFAVFMNISNFFIIFIFPSTYIRKINKRNKDEIRNAGESFSWLFQS